jgi:hypothetical protein
VDVWSAWARPQSCQDCAPGGGRGSLYTGCVPDDPSNPSDLVRGLEILRSAFAAPGSLGDSLPLALERAGEVRESIDRLTEEVATLNRHVERALPLLESFERQLGRTTALLESFRQAERGIQQLLRRGIWRPRDAPGEADSAGGEGDSTSAEG